MCEANAKPHFCPNKVTMSACSRLVLCLQSLTVPALHLLKHAFRHLRCGLLTNSFIHSRPPADRPAGRSRLPPTLSRCLSNVASIISEMEMFALSTTAAAKEGGREGGRVRVEPR